MPDRLEAAFQKEMEYARNRSLGKVGLIGLALYCIFAVADWKILPHTYQQAWQIRFFLVAPLILFGIFFFSRIRHRLAREMLLSGIVIVAGISIMWIAILSPHSNAQHYYHGVSLIILFGNVVLNLRFRDALITSVTLSAASVFFLSRMVGMPQEERLSNWLIGFSIAALSLLANFRGERDHRCAFLARSREQARNAELSDAVELLGKLSTEDALTQLANRREFDRRLHLEWGRARRQAQPLALILIDVDCFKAYNDYYGHPAGDACLRQIAAALHAVPRRSPDLVARLGGEEFAALLPATDLQDAAELAESMRHAILELRLPHVYSTAAPVVTGSFGVCAILPTGAAQSGTLLTEADVALYRAKKNGRNRIAVHIPQPATVDFGQ